MTHTVIKEQVRTIEKATTAASQTKETALKFLRDAGIVKSSSTGSKKK